MVKGTASMGRKSGKISFIRCRRCGNPSYHIRKKECAKCAFGRSKRLKSYNWQRPKI